MSLNILIADDHPLVREGLGHALRRMGDAVTITEASDYPSALSALATSCSPALIIIDLAMPGMGRFEGLKRILCDAGNRPVVVFSACEDPGDVRNAIELGARGFIPKSSQNAVLLAALKLVLSGGTYLPHDLLDEKRGKTGEFPVDVSVLTRRQREVVGLMSRGLTNKEIGRDLGLSPATIRTHIEAIFRALNVSNRTQATRVAFKLGLADS